MLCREHIEVPKEFEQEMPEVLKILVSCPKGAPPEFITGSSDSTCKKAQCLSWLESAELASSTEQDEETCMWKLTQKGMESVSCAIRLNVGDPVVRRGDLEDMKSG